MPWLVWPLPLLHTTLLEAQTDKNNPLTAVTTLYSTSLESHNTESCHGYHKLLLEDRASNESSRRQLLEYILLGALLLVHVGQHVQTLELLEQPRVGVVSPELQLALLGGGPVAGVTAMSPCVKSI